MDKKMNSNKVKNLIEKGINDGDYPRYVYKYRISDTKRNPYFDSIIETNSLMFSSPAAFNDPFDCQLQPVTFPSSLEISQFLNRVLPNASSKVISGLLQFASSNPNEFARMLEKAIKFDKKGVLCLSQNPDNILLWSHYADNHYGVCLKFDMLEDLDFFSIPFKVIYDQSYPFYNHMTETSDIVTKMIKTKYHLWAYEEEIRIFKNTNGIFNFNKKALVEIIFGCNTPQTEIDRIKKLTRANGYQHLKYQQTEKSLTTYGLNFKTA
jgi:hypothetical protein